jgi:hypothetical protein
MLDLRITRRIAPWPAGLSPRDLIVGDKVGKLSSMTDEQGGARVPATSLASDPGADHQSGNRIAMAQRGGK